MKKARKLVSITGSKWATSSLSSIFMQKRGYQGGSYIRRHIHLMKGCQISIRKADISQEGAEAIISSANDKLLHNTGVARALYVATGPDIQREAEVIVQKLEDPAITKRATEEKMKKKGCCGG
eukprot:TRINITY_DN2584_c0_g1_i4.p1 TRINITY_DN2584_c0_g1~~TRINITY_DN2584_c0_g1_i4.p1  ORF type:complete len:123 (+),score=14.27 TRINITY_DN2584_c0_g1_i4:24-392(+)